MHLFVHLKKEDDYTYDEKTKGVQLTEEGMSKAEKAFWIENLFDINTCCA